VIGQLAEQYLKLRAKDLLPTPELAAAPGETQLAAAASSCIDGLAFLSHINFDHQEMRSPPILNPGQAFEKGWRVLNTGTCTWDGSYRLVFVHGNEPAAQMGGQPQSLQGSVALNESTDLYVNLTAPLRPGTFQGYWQMENGQGQPFGERLEVGVQVPAVPTATPAPTQTPAPGINFAVDRSNIRSGECVLFSWDVQDAQAVYFYAEGEPWEEHGVAAQGQQQQCPPATTTFWLRAIKPNNALEVRQITIYVDDAAGSPSIQRFTVDPPNVLPLGQCLNLQWIVDGATIQISLTANGGPLWADAPRRGSFWHCPDIPGMVGYGLAAEGPGGTSRAQQNVNVVRAPSGPPAPTALPELPIIYSFAVNPNQIAAGDCVNISWSSGGATARVAVQRDGAIVLDQAPLTGSVQDCPAMTGQIVYSVTAYSATGQSDSRQETIQVSESTASNPLASSAWQVAAYYDGAQSLPPLSDTLLTVAFAADGSLQGSAGCNTYSGDYLADASQLAIEGLEVGSQVCDEPVGVMTQEANFLAALRASVVYQMAAGKLILGNGSDQVLLELIPYVP
jgi:heat shock protein HslJ